MATLTEVSGVARKVVSYGIVTLILVMLYPVAAKIVVDYWNKLHPLPPPPPTVTYGLLPPIAFPHVLEEATPEFKLETVEGSLPAMPNVGKVYLVEINKARLLSLDRTRQIARVMGFTREVVPLDEQTYKYIHQDLPAELVLNIVTWTLAYRYDWTTEPKMYITREVPAEIEAVSLAKKYFSKLGLMQSDLLAGIGKVHYYNATGSAMIPTDNSYEANFSRVDMFRAKKDSMPILTAGGDFTPVNVTFSGLVEPKQTVSANFQYSMVTDTEFATYPLKPVSQAWAELLAGKGYISKKPGPKITVRKVYLAYYESGEYQPFLQPIFVFDDRANGFLGYVPAVASAYLQVPTVTPATK